MIDELISGAIMYARGPFGRPNPKFVAALEAVVLPASLVVGVGLLAYLLTVMQ